MSDFAETWDFVPRMRPPEDESAAALVQLYPICPCSDSRRSLGHADLLLGRGSECQIHVDDQGASRQHARIEYGADGHEIVDLGSRNGTHVNDRRISRVRLNDGDYVRVGDTLFRYLAAGNPELVYYREVHRLAVADPLTGAYNRRYLTRLLERESARSVDTKEPLSVLLFDVDCFKQINDSLGHAGGDTILRQLACRIQGALRKDDVLCRYGGDEFAIVLRNTGYEAALTISKDLHQRVQEQPFQCHHGHSYAVTISIGVATKPGEEPLGPVELLDRADQNLYAAKQTAHRGPRFAESISSAAQCSPEAATVCHNRARDGESPLNLVSHPRRLGFDCDL